MKVTVTYPGVYTGEDSFPGISAAVKSEPTAIPVFACCKLEYEKLKGTSSESSDGPYGNPADNRINTDPDFYGFASWLEFQNSSPQMTSVDLIYRALRAYFDNGGSSCYVVMTEKLTTVVPLLADVSLLIAAGNSIEQASSELCDGPGKLIFGILDCPQNILDDTHIQIEALNQDVSETYNLIIENANLSGMEHPELSEELAALAYNFLDVQIHIAENLKNNLNVDLGACSQTSVYAPWLVASWADDIDLIPPSAAIAGVYCKIDRERGVWKSPANVPLQSGLKPCMTFPSEFQKQLSKAPAVNVIRMLERGTVVCGARTRAADPHSQWVHISVRRLVDSIERNLRQAMYLLMYEPNNKPTWELARSTIASYLYGLWQAGVLHGEFEREAYYIEIDNGATMTETDIAAGKMIVKVGVAAARPAEFIIISMSQTLQRE